MNVAIIGCGRIGQKRLQALSREHRLIATSDSVFERAQSLANQREGSVALPRWEDVISRPDVEAVFISTTNDSLAPIALSAVQNGKHVLAEKPAARNPREILPLLEIAQKSGAFVQVGYNHRYHPALQKAREIIDSGQAGPLMFVRGRYGHGGRIGYDQEWRADSEIAGGGELLDQGCHLVDLARWFLGEFQRMEGSIGTFSGKCRPKITDFSHYKRPQSNWLGCMLVARNGRIRSVSRSTGKRRNCKLMAWVEAMEWSD